MPYKHVPTPDKGMITNTPPTVLPDGASPYIKGMYLKDGEIVSDFGYTGYPDITDYNLLLNGNFESWSTWGVAVAPDGWQLSGAGASVGAGVDIVKLGTYSVAVTRAGTDCYLYQTVHETRGINYWKGRTVTFGCWVYATVASRARLYIEDGYASAASSFHTGDSTWQWLTVTHTVDATNAIYVRPSVRIFDGNTSAYFDGAICVEGTSVSGFVEHKGLTQTNHLHGSVMRLEQYLKTTGVTTLLALTTTNAYSYNTTTKTWDCRTQGVTVCDCETAWTASGSVGATADSSIKLRGTYSARMSVADAFTTGIAATYDFGAVDLHTYKALHFWVYSTSNLTAGDYQVGLSNTTALGGSPVYFDIPAVTANTWTPCCVAGPGTGGLFTGLTAVISTGLQVVNDEGAVVIYIDDIMAVMPFTGTTNNRFSCDIIYDTLICTNGVNQPQKWTGTGTFANLTTTLNTGAITTSEIAFAFKDHLLMMNNTENGGYAPTRVSWTNIGTAEDFINGTAGYQDLDDDASWIVAAESLNEDEFLIYKERSIVKGVWVGGQTPFRFYTVTTGTGALSKEGVAVINGLHVVFGPDNMYTIDGGTGIIYTTYDEQNKYAVVGNENKRLIYSRLNSQYSPTVFVAYIEEDDEVQLWIPTTAAYPDEIWCADVTKKCWYRKARGMTGFGFYISQSSLTIGDLVGTIGQQNWTFGSALTKSYAPITMIGDVNGYVYQINKAALDDNGVAIESEYQTQDFVIPDGKDFQNVYMRVPQLVYEAKGQSVTTYYSIDSGDTWSPTQSGGGNTVTLKSSYDIYQQDFDVTCRKIRFKFYKNAVSSGFSLRYYGFQWIPRSGRI